MGEEGRRVAKKLTYVQFNIRYLFFPFLLASASKEQPSLPPLYRPFDRIRKIKPSGHLRKALISDDIYGVRVRHIAPKSVGIQP